MTLENARVSRMTVFVALMMAFAMVGVPSFLKTGGVDADPIGTVSATPEDYSFWVGVIDYAGAMATMNPFLYTMAAEWMTIWPCYSTLIMFDIDDNYIGDIAESWEVTTDGKTWHFSLYDNAVFYDPRDGLTYPVTAEDVMFTYWLVQNDTKNHLHSYFPDVGDPVGPLIVDMWSVGDYELYIETRVPFAPFLSGLATIPIVPKYYWEGEDAMKFDNMPVVGSGWMYYDAEALPEQEGILKRNPYWFHEETRGWQIHVGQIVYKNYLTPATAYTGLKNGDIDCMMEVPSDTYLTEIPIDKETYQILGFAQSTGFVYEFNLNQMTDELRSELGGSFNTGSNNQLLLNPIIKEAMAMCINKEQFVEDVVNGLGNTADSLVPDCNPWHYTYPDPIEFNPSAARDMLVAAGWAYDIYGNAAGVDTVPLCKVGGTDPLSFNFYTLIPELEWEIGATLILEWCQIAGVELDLQFKSSNEMNNLWYAANYDTWLWDWIFGPTSDPSTDVLSVCTTMEIGSWSDVYYSNTTFDELYNRSLTAVDVDARRALTDEMQSMLYEDFGCQCIAYRQELYACTEQRWTNYGDWNATYVLMPDWGYPWLYMRLSPIANPVPDVQVDSLFEGEVGVSVPVSATISDPPTNSVEYRWFWGDGSSSSWTAGTSGTSSHTYTSDGYYTAYIAAREVGGDGFITWSKTRIAIYDYSNNAPYAAPGYELDPITYEPESPDTGDVIVFTSHFVDDESDELTYVWNFGDTYTGMGAVVEHQYTTPGTYEVTLSVDDGHLGSGNRPVVVSVLVGVTLNSPPTIDVPDFPNVVWKVPYTFTVDASDPDAEPLRYTWHWGDNTAPTVTTEPSATHTYTQKQMFTLTVYVDDLSGLPGHNVSDSGSVNVKSSNAAPIVDSYTVSTATAATDEVITFNCTAHDPEGDPLTFEFRFDDGTTEVFYGEWTLPDVEVTFVVDKAYDTAGYYSTDVRVSDGLLSVNSVVRDIEIVANDPPEVSPLADKVATEGDSLSFTASAFDPDMDPLTYWWDFGDGESASGQSVSHTYGIRGDYVFTVYVDDGNGHNETQNATAHITAEPVIAPLEDETVVEGVLCDFAAEATDADDDTLTYWWDFGDGESASGQYVSHAYPVTGSPMTYTFTVWVNDNSPVLEHNVSASATANVLVAGVNYPPTVGTLADEYGVVDVEMTFTISASDPDSDPLTFTWDFGDGTVVVDAATTTHTYTAANDYTVTVYVADDTGDPTHNISRTAMAYVSADAAPVADAGPDQTVDEDTIVYFDGGGSSDDVGIAHYYWTIVELSVTLDDVIEPFYTFDVPDVYTVTLVVEDTIGQLSAEDSMIVTVEDVTDPVADAGADQTVAFGDTVTFDGTLSSDNVGIVNYTWVLNDGGVVQLYGVSPTYVFSEPGVFTVRLFVTDAAGNDDYDEVDITVEDLVDPVADAGPDDTVDMGDMVTFDGSGTTDNAGIAEYMWTFDYDGAPETLYGVAPVFTFNIPGVYEVTLTVTDLGGNTDVDTVIITVVDIEDPVADAGADQEVAVGEEVTFDGSGSSDNVGVVSYDWTFEYDGATETLTGVSPTFTFDIADEYVVTLTVEDAEGNSATDTVTITVTAVNDPPVADAGIDQTVTVGDTVTFDGSGSSDDSAITNYTWTFTYDDVSRELYDEGPTFTFEIVDTYTVTLTVTDDDGATDTDTMQVVVEDMPSVTLAADAGPDQTVTVGETVTFDGGDSTGDIASYTWTFTYDGETRTLTGESPTFTFDIVGTYTVTLTVEDADGATDTDTVVITVEEEDEDKKSFIDSYGLLIGVIVVLIILALVLFFVMKKRKGGGEPAELEEMSAGEPEVSEGGQ